MNKLGNPALTGNFTFPKKVNLLNIEFLNLAKNHSYGSSKCPNQNLRQIALGDPDL